jgi:hypothetical protein
MSERWIAEFWSYPQSRAVAELLIDGERTERFERCSSGCCARPVNESGAAR